MAVLTASRNVSVLVASRANQSLPREHTKKAPHWGAFFVSALCISIFFTSFQSVAAQARCPELHGGFLADVEYVHDGDTLSLSDGRKVRLIGVNTPELGRDDQPDQHYSTDARYLLQKLVGKQKVRVFPGVESHDRYGRLLAHLYLQDGRLVAEEMVRAGLGHALAVGSNHRLADCLFAAEREVRQQAEKLWSLPLVMAGDIKHAGFVLAQGRVTRITSTRRGMYLDLDDNLALFLPQSLVGELPESEWRKGQLLEVRGWVVDRLQRRNNVSEGQMRWLLSVTHKYHIHSL